MTEAEVQKLQQVRDRWSDKVEQPLGVEGRALARADVRWLARQLAQSRGETRYLKQALVEIGEAVGLATGARVAKALEALGRAGAAAEKVG